MVRNHYLLWAFALRHRGLRLPVIVIKSTLSVATISPVPATLHHLLLHLSFTCIRYALLSLLTVQHFSQRTLFHRQPTIQFMLLLNPSLSLLLLSFHLFFSLWLSSFISFLFYRSIHHFHALQWIHHIAQLHRVARRIGRPPSTRWHERSWSLSLYFCRIVTNWCDYSITSLVSWGLCWLRRHIWIFTRRKTCCLIGWRDHWFLHAHFSGLSATSMVACCTKSTFLVSHLDIWMCVTRRRVRVN